MYAKAIRILVKGYLPILLITPMKLREILNTVKMTVRKTNPDYDIVIKTSSLLQFEISYFCHRHRKQFDHTISSIHTALHTAAI